MKLPEIEYDRPLTLEAAVRALADSDAKILAGGQSLIPMMAYRLATPGKLVDIGRIPGLREIRFDDDGIRLGACVRWRDIENERRFLRGHPLLLEGVRHVAHYQVRNRGTIGGSLAHADPAAEMPAIAIACDAEMVVLSENGQRVVPASDFFLGPLTTALEPTDLLVEVRLPKWPPGRKFAFEEFARRRGDFALAGVCLFYDLDEGGHVVAPHVAGFGAIEMPMRLTELEHYLSGRLLDPSVCEDAGAMASRTITPVGDMHASAAYRSSLFGTLVERALGRSMNSVADDDRAH